MTANRTRFLPVAKAVLFRATQGGVELAASAAFPGVGAVVSKALEPVFEEIGRRIGVDPTTSPEKAAEELEAAPDLQEMLDERLSRIIGPLRDVEARQGALSDGQKQLLRVAEGNRDAIQSVAERLDLTIEPLLRGVAETLYRGVAVSDVGVIRIADEVLARLQSLERENAEERDRRDRRFKGHIARTQARAVELVRENQFDRAADELKAGLELLESLLETTSGDTHLTVQLGYFFKTIAQEFARQGLAEQERDFNDQALGVFQSVVSGTPHSAKTVRDYVDALNGLGNILYARRSYSASAGYYRIATTIDPTYAYAWHDLFGALHELAKRGGADVADARQALDMTRRTGTGQPGLGAAYLDECERRLHGLEASLATTAGKGQAASGTRHGDPIKADDHTRAGKALLFDGDAEGALREFEAALKADQRFLEARSARGAVLVGLDRVEEGLAELNAVIAEAPDHLEARYNRACVHSLQGDFGAAIRDLARAGEVEWFRRQAQSDPHLARLRDDPGLSACFAAVIDGN